MFYYRREKLAEHLLAVPVEDYYCYFHLFLLFFN